MSEQSTPARADEQVEYRDVVGFPGYRVGSDGSVWSCLRLIHLSRGGSRGFLGTRSVLGGVWRRLRTRRMKNGYVVVTIRCDRRSHHFLVHRLVLQTFVGPCPPGMECRHLDGDAGNNRLANLCWGTPAENAADQDRHGTKKRGDAHPQARLTYAVADQIRADVAAGMTHAAAARSRGISPSLVSLIVHNHKWVRPQEATS